MDNAFSNLIPQYRIGRDGFNWWIGQVEKTSRGEEGVKGANRYKVRIVGEHLKDCEVVPSDDLPWASVMMPVTVPFSVGNTTGAHSQLKEGSWVIGFYLDPEKQKPIIMGSIGMTPGATKIITEYDPGKCNSFTTYIDPNINVAKDGLPPPANKKSESSSQTDKPAPKREPQPATEAGIQTGKNIFDPSLAAQFNSNFRTDIDLGLNIDNKNIFGNGGGTFAAFSTSAEGSESLQNITELAWGCIQPHDPPVPSAQISPLAKDGQASEDWCQEKAKKCGPEDMKTTTTRIIGEFLAEVQRNNGNIGTYLVSESTGALYDGVYTARRYVNKFIFVVKHFVAKVKGFIIEKLQEGVEKLIKALLKATKLGDSLTTVVEWSNKVLKDLGCQMADVTDRLVQWVTDLLMGLLEEAYRSAACLIDALVNGILSKLTQLMESIIDSILGPLEAILGPAAKALNLVGGAIAKVMEFLGITCSGPEAKCSKDDSECTNGAQKEKKGDFLDDLLDMIDNELFPDTSADYTQYTCDEAYEGKPLETTTVGFRGGTIDTNKTKPGQGNFNNDGFFNVINYSISDVTVVEGSPATFTVKRSGYIEAASSITFKTISGTAQSDIDFIKVDDILGFAPNQTEKTYSIKTINDGNDDESEENFYVKIGLNSPKLDSGIKSTFETKGAICTIVPYVKDSVDNYNPYKEFNYTPKIIDEALTAEIEEVFGEEPDTEFNESPSAAGKSQIAQYSVTADKTVAEAGDFIVYTITTKNVADGTVEGYILSPNFNPSDIVGKKTSSTFVVNNGKAKVTIGIEDGYTSDTDEILRFNVSSTSAFADVLISSTLDLNDDIFEGSTGEAPAFTPFTPPTVNPEEIITDDSGKIIEIPISNPGGPYIEPPFVFIGGEGIGASAIALLDNDGFVSELRVTSGGYGYKKNLPADNGKRCIIDTFTLLRPGAGYTSAPKIYINNDSSIAETIINEKGYVIGARVLNRQATFDEIPEVIIIGGGGYGAKLIPSLACLPESGLVDLGATKIGTGKYIDCP